MNKLVYTAIAIATVIYTLTIVSAHAQAQSTNNATVGAVMNLTNYFKENKGYQECLPPIHITGLTSQGIPPCIPTIIVLFQSPNTLALSSDKVDIIWKAVDFAKTLGYHTDGITSYVTRSSSDVPGSVNILVSMSR